MKNEIERKFLVKKHLLRFTSDPIHIKQGFLSDDPKRAVRIRIADDQAFITIKGESDVTGSVRLEFEQEIPKNEAEQLIGLCKGHTIEKLRYREEVGDHIFEIDIFKGKNEGLIIAEVELSDLHENIEIPEWLSEEVTGNNKYFNLYLSQFPYDTWQ